MVRAELIMDIMDLSSSNMQKISLYNQIIITWYKSSKKIYKTEWTWRYHTVRALIELIKIYNNNFKKTNLLLLEVIQFLTK